MIEIYKLIIFVVAFHTEPWASLIGHDKAQFSLKNVHKRGLKHHHFIGHDKNHVNTVPVATTVYIIGLHGTQT